MIPLSPKSPSVAATSPRRIGLYMPSGTNWLITYVCWMNVGGNRFLSPTRTFTVVVEVDIIPSLHVTTYCNHEREIYCNILPLVTTRYWESPKIGDLWPLLTYIWPTSENIYFQSTEDLRTHICVVTCSDRMIFPGVVIILISPTPNYWLRIRTCIIKFKGWLLVPNFGLAHGLIMYSHAMQCKCNYSQATTVDNVQTKFLSHRLIWKISFQKEWHGILLTAVRFTVFVICSHVKRSERLAIYLPKCRWHSDNFGQSGKNCKSCIIITFPSISTFS
jgi:hypothetical protein